MLFNFAVDFYAIFIFYRLNLVITIKNIINLLNYQINKLYNYIMRKIIKKFKISLKLNV